MWPVTPRRARARPVLRRSRDLRAGVVRRRPGHRQARHRRRRHRRRIRRTRDVVVPHRHRDGLGPRLLPVARATGRLHLHHIGVVGVRVLRVLVVGRRLERQRAGVVDREQRLVRAAAERVAGHGVGRVAVLRLHRAHRRLVLRRVEGRARGERRRRVRVRRAAARSGPAARALGVRRPHLHLVVRVLLKPREDRASGPRCRCWSAVTPRARGEPAR